MNLKYHVYLLECLGFKKLTHQKALSNQGMAGDRLQRYVCSEGLEFILRGNENPLESFLQGSNKIRFFWIEKKLEILSPKARKPGRRLRRLNQTDGSGPNRSVQEAESTGFSQD